MLEIVLELISREKLVILSLMMISGMAGALAKFIVQNYDFNKNPYTIEEPKAKSWNVVGAYLIARIFLGALAGILVGFILVDALKSETDSLLRVLFFGVLAGYSAPSLMKSQEKIIIGIVNKQVEKSLTDLNNNEKK